MFTGIVESIGTVKNINADRDNIEFEIQSSFTSELKVDQSVSHNGVCLTVTKIHGENYFVTAIRETLQKTNLSKLKNGDAVNLERCMKLGDRLDGHIVQGHVDTVAQCENIEDQSGSWKFYFKFLSKPEFVTVAKGSITVNGVSLTVVDSHEEGFSVAIIPYTLEHTNFRNLKKGSLVNIEFDVIGKYVAKMVKPIIS